jgi:hypothetical protein
MQSGSHSNTNKVGGVGNKDACEFLPKIGMGMDAPTVPRMSARQWENHRVQGRVDRCALGVNEFLSNSERT